MPNIIGKRFAVLDRGWVELLDFMPHPETGVSGDTAIVNAARVSFLGDSKGPDRDKKLLFYLMQNNHTSPFEQVEFKFRVHAPLVVWWQWIRHRTWSINMQSGRYTPFDEDEFYAPSVWRAQSKDNKQASDGTVNLLEQQALMAKLKNHYNTSYNLYQYALEAGVSREMARLFLPGFSVYYTGVVKVDAHNLMGFLRLRNHEHAQQEIREYARMIETEIFAPLLPWTTEAFTATL